MVHNLSLLICYWRAVLLLVVLFALAPGRAAAECGDYITIRKPTENTHHFQSMPAVDKVEANDTSLPPTTKQPCQGPNCSSAPNRQSNPLTNFVPVTTRVKELVKYPTFMDDETTLDSSSIYANVSHSPIHRTFPIFHPPRLG